MAVHRLLPVLTGGKEALPSQALAEVMALNGPRPGRFIWEIVKAWAVIAGAIALAVWIHSAWVTVLAILVIATRQNVLGLLVHEQTHLGLGGRYGDWVASLFCAFPLLVLTVDGYARVHLAHHRDYFTSADPDALRKAGPEWTFPKRGWELARLFLGDLLGLNTLKMVRGKGASHGAPIATAPRKAPAPKWLRLLFLLVLAAVLTWTGAWWGFFLFWFLPLVTLMPVIVRWGAVCEHEYNRPDADMLSTTPLIIQPWYERLLMPMLNFGMHPYHHLFPGIGFSKLPEVHRIFQREGLVREDRVFRGSLQYLRFLTGAAHETVSGPEFNRG